MNIRIKKLFDNWVHFKTNVMEFEVLFSDDENVKSLRKELLPDFFMDLNDFYWDNFMITIYRLLDKYKQGKNLNLTLFTLVEILKKKNNSWNSIEEKNLLLKKKYRDILNYRSKYFAHYDLYYSTGAKKFSTSTHINKIHEFLKSMHEIINNTIEALGEPKNNYVVTHPAIYRGAKKFLLILKNEKKVRLKDDELLEESINKKIAAHKKG